jgi:carbamoyl-phosphate synthase large subunit
MKSVGEAMAIGRTFKEAFLKAVRSLELGRHSSLFPSGPDDTTDDEEDETALRKRLVVPSDRRMWALFRALRRGWDLETLHELTRIDRWFLQQFCDIDALRKMAALGEFREMSADLLRTMKRSGFSDADIAAVYGIGEELVRQRRLDDGPVAAYKRIDTCAAEFESFTPYMYGTFEDVDEAEPTPAKKVVILGSGPNRIGQGIEFDYCCVHAVFGFREEGFETVMVNCNPETVSTDYDTADRLYFEPLTFEDVMAIIERERSAGGDVSCVVQFGGQTPLKLALPLLEAGVTILGTSPDSIDLAEDRQRFSQLLWDLGVPQPASGTAVSRDEARDVAERIGYPVVVRPSYVLGGRGMAIVFDTGALDRYMTGAVDVSHDRPVLIDRFLEDAFEFDVDAVADSTGAVIIGGIMEHIEEAGIHSGDSSCVVPPFMVAERHLGTIREYTRRIARALKVVGLMNIQYAIKDDTVYVLEVNPRSSRTVPYISKATGVPLAKIAARVAAGRTLAELGLVEDLEAAGVFVKSPVFPFMRFPGVDTILGPEMKSTGEVMGGADNFGAAFAKAMMGAALQLPEKGSVFISVNNSDKQTVLPIARDLAEIGFSLAATRGTAAFLRAHGLQVEVMYKVNEGRPNVADHLVNRSIDMVVNTPLGRDSFFDDRAVRRAATMAQVPCITTLTGASAAVQAIRALRQAALTVRSLQDYYAAVKAGA